MARPNSVIASVGVLSAVAILWSSQCVIAGTPPLLLAQAPPAQPPQNIEANIAQLHQRLQITPAQEAQFNAVANIMRENARAEASMPQQPTASATAIDDLRAYIRYGEVELAGLKKMLPALEGLYATLSPAQKKAADAAFREGPGG
jgi:protein CpxP